MPKKQLTIVVVGCGRMGSEIAKRLKDNYSVLVYDKDVKSAQKLSEKLQINVAYLEDLKKADVIILALATEIIPIAIEEIEEYLQNDAILVNIATTFEHEKIKAKHKFASAKIIGHAKEIAIGEKPVVIVEGKDESTSETVAEIFKNIGTVIIGDTRIVSMVNTIASRQGVLAGMAVKEELEKLNLPEEITIAAIRLVAAGTMKAFALGDAGPFVQKIIDEEKGKGN